MSVDGPNDVPSPFANSSRRMRVVRPDGEDATSHWSARLVRNDKGKLRRATANAISILVNDPSWVNVLGFDEFAQAVVKRGAPPWHEDDAHTRETGEWADEDSVRVQAWLTRSYGLDIGLEAATQAVTLAAQRHPFHPVRDFLRGLVWDGMPRIHHWLIHLLGAEDCPYVRAVGRAFLISLVARVMRPGCKVDTMLVLEGEQGSRKSTALRMLVGDAWFVELAGEIDPRETPQLLRRKWLGEFAELSSFKRTREIEMVKSFLSRVSDTYRPPYGRAPRDFPRQTVFAGSTNEDRYLQDATGARRFWPIKCGLIHLRHLEVERSQLWAEALLAYDAGEAWYLGDDVLAASKTEQDERYEEDAWTDASRDWLGGRVLVGATISELLTGLGVDRAMWTHMHASRAGTILRRLGWKPRGRSRPRRYWAPDPACAGGTVPPTEE